MSNTDFTKPTDEADKQEALDLWKHQIAYDETIYNGSMIRWRYWVEQMPQLSAAEAARLMSALDPDLFANLDNRPNKNDPSKRCERAAVIQRLAERKGMQVATPAEWLAWAIQEGFVVHDGFRLAVESAPAQNAATPVPDTVKPLQRSAAQDAAILTQVKSLGFDPLALPQNKPGKAGVKSAVRNALSKDRLFIGAKVFDKAWERLSATGEIVIQK